MDSGFYHLFSPEQCDELIDEVASVLLADGCYYLHEFAVEFPIPNVPRQITTQEIETKFSKAKGWQIEELQNVSFLSSVAPPVAAICACIRKLA
ncbi:MAG: hypothetical protein R2865_12630 [Deinococcales bacterium]